MALPTLEKTWQFNVNNVIPAGATALENFQKTLFKIKEILTTFPISPWVVTGSSNTVTAGDNVDYWATYADVVWANSTYSFIALRQPGLLSSGAEIAFNCASTNPGVMYVSASELGYSGMTLAGGLTNTDQIVPGLGDWLHTSGAPFGAPFQSVVHGMQSTDGKSTRIFVCVNGIQYGGMLFEEITDPVSGMTQPWYTFVKGAAQSQNTDVFERYNLFQQNHGKSRDGSTNYTQNLTVEGMDGLGTVGTVLPVINEISNEYFLAPIGVAGTTTGKRGRHGRIVDLWEGNLSIPTGSTYPSGSSRQFAQFGNLVFPWNGSTPVVT